MLKLMCEKCETLQIRFEGSNEIDADTFRQTLNDTIDSLKIIADASLTEDDYCKFKILNIEKGSFAITLGSYVLSNLPFIIQNADSIFSIYLGVVELKKHLKGHLPASIEKEGGVTKITNTSGDVNIFQDSVVNMYINHPKLDESISNSMDKLNEDDERQGVSYTLNGKKTLEISSEEKQILSQRIDVTEITDTYQTIVSQVILTIIKPDFHGNSKWEFFINGSTKIKAFVSDSNFLDELHDRKYSFNAGTKLNVKLETKYKITKEGLPDEKSKPQYRIIEVVRVIDDDSRQISIFD